ncbi:MAG: TonB-dependent receptor [Bacteroidales bacterium]|nr:TonB-dependent receptor [Bacteroidales bacterium]
MKASSLYNVFLLFVVACVMTPAAQGQKVIAGTVTDCNSGKPLSGTNIQILGAGLGTFSGSDGHFILIAQTGERIRLRLSFVGYLNLERTLPSITGSDTIRISLCMTPAINLMEELFVTATRTPQKPAEIPARIASIPAKEMMEMPVNNTDEILQLVPGIKFDRDFGIFSKNSSVTMRGLNGSYRALILLDGVPLNKTDGGGINWNRLIPDNIERIEVLKGPVSAVYGSNAMSGVINIISEKPSSPFEGKVKAFYGTYQTFGGLLKLGGSLVEKGKGLYYSVSGFYRQGKGYITQPDSSRTSFDTSRYLKEGTLSGMFGYQFNERNGLEMEYNYYNDIRGDGTKIYEPLGSYNRYPTHFVRLSSHNGWGKYSLLANAFYQHENYIRQNETMSKKSGKYTLYETDSKRVDYGLWLNLTNQIRTNQALTVGMDLKQGSVNASDTYYTSSDILTNKGTMSFFALFAEYEINLLKSRMTLTGGIRWDIAWFTNGSFTIEYPSTLSEFMTTYPSDFSDDTWNAFSPKLGIRYNFNASQSLYFSYAHGFRPPILDDMCKNGNISKGFKMANPGLKPETLDNVEIGGTFTLFKRVVLEPSGYLSYGRDFQYFVSNGDSVYTGGSNLKPVMQRDNISGVRILGAEISVTVPIINSLSFIANYAYNDSRITKFDTLKNPGKDLSGKYLMEVPDNQAFAGVLFTPRWLSAALTCRYLGPQWIDDENTAKTNGYFTMDFKVSHIFFDQLTAGITIQDLMNRQWVDSKGQLSPGRFILLNLSYRFTK